MRADGSPSSTALLIAASTLLSAGDGRGRVEVAAGAAPLCERLLTPRYRWLARSARWAPTRWLWRRLESATLPGVQAHWWHRKRAIEAELRALLSRQGLRRLIVLGAGLDTLGWRLAEETGLEVIEIDHPATQALKAAALRQGGPASLRLLPLDLGTAALPPLDWHHSLVIAEGLLMYLQPARVDALFRELAVAAPQRLIFSCMARWPDGRDGFRPYSALVERFLAWRQEPFAWALEPAGIEAWLLERGWRRLLQRDAAALRPAGDPSRLEGELLISAQPL